MYAKFTSLVPGLGEASQDTAQQIAHGAAKVTDLVQLSTRIWIDVMTETVNDTTKAFTDLAACRTPSDFAEAQQHWFEAMNRRHLENLNKIMELSAVVVGGMEMPPPADAPVAVPAASSAPAATPVDATPATSPAKTEATPDSAAAPAPAEKPAPKAAPKAAKANKTAKADAETTGDDKPPFGEAVAARS